MLRSEPVFDPSSKEINVFERRDASIAVTARLLLAQRSSVIDLLVFVYIMLIMHNQSQRIEKCWKDKYCILIKSYQMFRGLFKFEPSIHYNIRTPPLCLTDSQDSRQWRWIYYLFSLCSLWPVGQNYANQCQNPNAVILW